MRDITDILNNFRECIRHILNTYFYGQPHPLGEGETYEYFEEVYEKLFFVLILAKLGEYEWEYVKNAPYGKPMPFIHIIPNKERIPIMINRPTEQGPLFNYWDDPLKEIMASDAVLHLIDFFDWDNLAYRNFTYYEVKIISFPQQPHLEGRKALIDTADARAFFKEDK